MMDVTIERRFNGPPESGNGGYSCGVLGTMLGDSATVTLRKPPPLDSAMSVVEVGFELEMRDDNGGTVAVAREGRLDLEIPQAPTLDEAQAAQEDFVGFVQHRLPTCFVCGPDHDDRALKIFPGKLEDREAVAAVWTPAPDTAAQGHHTVVDRRIVWAALDCPTYFGGRLRDYPEASLLGRMTARIDDSIAVGEPHIVLGWPIGREGRKWDAGCAIFDATGTLKAASCGRWIELTG